ncbi:MAG TPA: protein-L-isoaspartate O-methyltransferase, partial [Spirochaetia bacterium]|nr:protein-L-isoaspartate O-methyltransferase [Spirochaetia bacterium]
DRIIVTTGIDHIPPELLRELKPGGIMVIPVGPPTGQVVLKITKTVDASGQVHLTREDIYHGMRKEIFVPFTAASGGTHNTGSTQK